MQVISNLPMARNLVAIFGKKKGTELYKMGLTVEEEEHRLEWWNGLINSIIHNDVSYMLKGIAYNHRPVGIRVFIENPFFMDKAGTVYPAVMTELEEINSGKYVETVYTGGVGSGKTTAALYTICYQTYLLSCMQSPHKVFGLDASSEILMVFQSLTATLSKTLDYARFKSMVDGCQYFKDNFAYNKDVESRLDFPNRISVIPLSGKETAAIGQNVYGGILDECLVGNTAIITNTGEVPISSVVVGDLVDSGCGWDEVTASSCTGIKLTTIVTFDDGSILEGHRHPVATDAGWALIEYLRTGDIVYASTERPRSLCAMEGAVRISTQREEVQLVRAGYTGTERSSSQVECICGGKSFINEKSETYDSVCTIGRREGCCQCNGEKESSALCEISGEPQSSIRNVRGDEQHRGNEKKAVREQQASEFNGCNAYTRSASTGGSEPRGFETFGRNEEEAIFGASQPVGREKLYSEVSVGGHQANNSKEVCSVELRSSVDCLDGENTGCTVVQVRTDEHPLWDQAHRSRFSNKNNSGSVLGGDKAVLRGTEAAREIASYEESRGEGWLGVFASNRKRVVSVRRGDFKPVYNITTKTKHTYVANGVITHNCNYMAVTEGSKKSLDGEVFDQAVALYNSISRRRKSRFASTGLLPGMLCLVSSKRYPGQFTDIKEKESQTDKTIYIYDKRVWDIKPEGSFSGVMFQVFIGDEGRRPRILGDAEYVDPEDRHLVDDVPVEYKTDFERDITNSLREIAGKSTLATHPFIVDTNSITRCMSRPTTSSIFSAEYCDFVQYPLYLLPENFHKPQLQRAAHIDLGITGDSAGLAIMTVTGFEKMIRQDGTPGEVLPKYHVDGVLEVRPPKGGEILFWKIRSIIMKLRELGLNIQWVSLDSFQSRDTLQILRQQGFVTGLLSVDKTMLPYETLKTALYDSRVSMPFHVKLRKELASLENDTAKGKVDHPSLPGSSKDCADAVAACSYVLASRRIVWATHGISVAEMPEQFRKLASGISQEEAPQKEEASTGGMYSADEMAAWGAAK